MKKRIISIILALVLSLSVTSTAYANEKTDVSYDNPTMTITVSDEYGNDIVYEIAQDSEVKIPLYAAKEGDVTYRSLTVVATLNITIFAGYAYFDFVPVNFGIALLTLGFTGTFTTYNSGLRYGNNNYLLPVLSGTVSASTKGTGSISGSYSVLGYSSASVLQGFSW